MKNDGKNPESPIEGTSLSLSSGEMENGSDKATATSEKDTSASGNTFRPIQSPNPELNGSRKISSETPASEAMESVKDTQPSVSVPCQEGDGEESCTSPATGSPDCHDLKDSKADNTNGIPEATEAQGEDKSEGLERIKQHINEHYEQVEKHFLVIGKDLLEAKAILVKHGGWLKWVRKNTPFSARQAQRLMRVAERFGNNTTLVSYLDFTKAYILTRLSDKNEKDFLEGLKQPGIEADPFQIVQAMSKDDLESAIRKYLRDPPGTQKTWEAEETEVKTSTTSNAADEVIKHLSITMDSLVQDAINGNIGDALIEKIRSICNDALDKLN